jgi:hypothetical protein
VVLRQSYARTGPEALLRANRYAHARQLRRMRRQVKKLRSKRQRFSPLAVLVARCLLHIPWQQGFNLLQRIGRRDVLQYMM